MGIGGTLVTISALQKINKETKKKILISMRPNISDLLRFSLLGKSEKFNYSDLFRQNKFIVLYNRPIKKARIVKFVDRFFVNFLYKFRLLDIFDSILISISQIAFRRKTFILMYINSSRFSYGKEKKNGGVIWKIKSKNLLNAILSGFRPQYKFSLNFLNPPSLPLKKLPRKKISILEKFNLVEKNYIVFEPVSNKEWFGNVREWPMKNWNELLELINKNYPSIKLVRIGTNLINKKKFKFSNFLDLTGQTNFIDSLSVIQKSKIFIGLEGGMMHMSASVNKESLIIWGCLTSPKFASYTNLHRILYNNRKCNHDFFPKKCPDKSKCINYISPKIVFKEFEKSLKKFKSGIIYLNKP